jgi:maltodextrin utilization protein YvdJ
MVRAAIFEYGLLGIVTAAISCCVGFLLWRDNPIVLASDVSYFSLRFARDSLCILLLANSEGTVSSYGRCWYSDLSTIFLLEDSGELFHPQTKMKLCQTKNGYIDMCNEARAGVRYNSTQLRLVTDSGLCVSPGYSGSLTTSPCTNPSSSIKLIPVDLSPGYHPLSFMVINVILVVLVLLGSLIIKYKDRKDIHDTVSSSISDANTLLPRFANVMFGFIACSLMSVHGMYYMMERDGRLLIAVYICSLTLMLIGIFPGGSQYKRRALKERNNAMHNYTPRDVEETSSEDMKEMSSEEQKLVKKIDEKEINYLPSAMMINNAIHGSCAFSSIISLLMIIGYLYSNEKWEFYRAAYQWLLILSVVLSIGFLAMMIVNALRGAISGTIGHRKIIRSLNRGSFIYEIFTFLVMVSTILFIPLMKIMDSRVSL